MVMAPTPGDARQFRFSTRNIPPARRIPLWHEVFGRAVTRRLLTQASQDACNVDMTANYLPQRDGVSDWVCVQRMHLAGGLEAQRSRELLSDGNDALVLHIQQSGQRGVSQLGREVTTRPGEGLLTSNADTSTIVLPEPSRFVSIGLPRDVMVAMAPGIEEAVVRPLADTSGILALLMNYLSLLGDGEALPTPELRRAAANHIQDLCALAVGAAHDAAEIARGRGLRAARLRTLKGDIAQHLGETELSAAALALRHGITPRYVHKLFESEGTTLSRYVLHQRLARFHRLLADRRFAALPISTLAYDAGFGDLSTFNRAFRRHFGATPSEVRAEAAVSATGRQRP